MQTLTDMIKLAPPCLFETGYDPMALRISPYDNRW